MSYGGWVQLRRGFLDHTHQGRLTNDEALVLIVLIMLAHRATGAGTINAPSLRHFLPDLSYDASKRVLKSLEEKRYIYRRITPFSKKVYQFWVNRYQPSTGQHESLQIDLSKVFESGDVRDIQYVKAAPDGARDGAPDHAPDAALHYKKGKKTKDTRDEFSSVSGEGEQASVCAAVSASAKEDGRRASGCASPSASSSEAETTRMRSTTEEASALPCAAQRTSADKVPRADPQIPPLQTPEMNG